MSKRVRGSKADSFRWFTALNTPNFPQFGPIGDVANPPIPYVSVGGLIVVSADVNMPDVPASTAYETPVLTYYNPIEELTGQQSGFLPIGCAVMVGAESSGLAAPTGNVTAKFALLSSVNGSDGLVLWETTNITMEGVNTHALYTSMTASLSSTLFQPGAIGVNSRNSSALAPNTQLDVRVTNQSGVTTIGAGGFRFVIWGIEF